MKTAAIVLVILVLVVGGLFGYGLFNTSLQITGKNLQTFSALERQDEFNSLRIAMEQNSLLGTVLHHGALGSPDEYSYYVYTLRLENPGLIDAEMVEIQIAPISQDVLFYGPTEEIIIPAGQTRDIWCVLLTKGAPHVVRDLHITYYLWGHDHEIKYTYNQGY
ncbi:MAG: hypothetical protein IJD39_08605 [Clostridia bacterium]|nr:hypothetical protein [Clostridia bacterium]